LDFIFVGFVVGERVVREALKFLKSSPIAGNGLRANHERALQRMFGSPAMNAV